MIHFHYNWDDERFPNFKKRMMETYQLSSRACDNPQQLNQTFAHLEDYYASIIKLGYVSKSNFQNVLDAFLNLLMIQYLDFETSKKYNGTSYLGMISLNPNPGLFKGLNKEESKRLCIYHELGHLITGQNRDDLQFFQKHIFPSSEIEKKYGGMNYDISYHSFCEGFAAIDEVVAENVGEASLYYKKNMPRPKMVRYNNKAMYPKGEFSSNFHEYMELQELVYSFAKNLSFIDSKDKDMNSILFQLSKAMFSNDFYKRLWDEFYLHPEKLVDMAMQLICMGKIKQAKYACYEDNRDLSKLDVSKYYQLFYQIQSSYEDMGRKEREKNHS